MGIRRKDYIMLGADIGYENFKQAGEFLDDEKFLEMESYIHYNEKGKITIIPDHEEERGCFVGYLIAVSDEYAGFEKVHKICYDLDDDEPEEISCFIYNYFDTIIDAGDVGVIVFTQWS